ncbi:MAG: hypothetical protein RL088_3767 [Verrucomicrobiota bacterium]
MKKRILYVAHNHPSVRPGGAEAYALELYEAMKSSPDFEPIFLAKGGPPMANTLAPTDGALISRVNADPNQYFLYTHGKDYDWLHNTSRNKEACVEAFADFLRAYRPEVVHFQHTLFLGYDFIRQVKTTLPNARILYTLHEYLPICHRHGQMLRTNNEELCMEATPRRCAECFPDIAPAAFFLRERFVKSNFALVDQFIAPSRFLLERFVDWGIPREKIIFEEYGRRPQAPEPEVNGERPRNRIGFFGQFTFYKGPHVLLRAIQQLSEDAAQLKRGSRADLHVWLHGANLDLQTGTYQNEFKALVDANRANLTLAGKYQVAEVPRLMANVDWIVVPSLWWENSPLVIQEAFMNKRPVICSDIGGMAEKVVHEKNGLHFRAGDPRSLAAALHRSTTEPGLWSRLRAGIPDIYNITDSVRRLCGIYHDLLK